MRRYVAEEPPRPLHPLLVFRWGIPAAVDVAHIHRVAMGVRRRVCGRPHRSSADLTEKDFAVRRREVASVLYRRLDGSIAKIREIVRLPIVASARGQQRVKRLLPGAIRLHADVFPERFSEMPHRFDRLPPGFRVAGMKERKRDDLGAVHRRRKERKRRGLAQYRPDRGLVALFLGRITSYNVCYTKLLRTRGPDTRRRA